MNENPLRKCPNPVVASWQYLPADDRLRFRVRCLRDMLFKRYLEYKSGHISPERWKQKKRPRIFHLPPKEETTAVPPENVAAIELLKAWRNEDAEEQRETWEYLRKVIDEDRLSDRKFFS